MLDFADEFYSDYGPKIKVTAADVDSVTFKKMLKDVNLSGAYSQVQCVMLTETAAKRAIRKLTPIIGHSVACASIRIASKGPKRLFREAVVVGDMVHIAHNGKLRTLSFEDYNRTSISLIVDMPWRFSSTVRNHEFSLSEWLVNILRRPVEKLIAA